MGIWKIPKMNLVKKQKGGSNKSLFYCHFGGIYFLFSFSKYPFLCVLMVVSLHPNYNYFKIKNMTKEDLDAIKNLLAEVQGSPKEVLTSDEAAAYLGISKSALYKLTMGRKIPFYKSAKLCYFDRQEIIAWMKANRVATQEELDAKAREIVKKGGRK